MALSQKGLSLSIAKMEYNLKTKESVVPGCSSAYLATKRKEKKRKEKALHLPLGKDLVRCCSSYLHSTPITIVFLRAFYYLVSKGSISKQ
jgi:hypothetical protein